MILTAPTTAALVLPVVDFSANVTGGTAPLAVLFTGEAPASTGWAWFFGDESYTEPWTEVNASYTWASTAWPPRLSHASAVAPGGSIILAGGTVRMNEVEDMHDANDTWRSSDSGRTWTLVNASSGWLARYGHRMIGERDNSVLLIGGNSKYNFQNDVWRSADLGETWTLVNASAGWSPREFHSVAVLPDETGSLVLTGGWDGGTVNDTWRSSDGGATWTLVNASSGWVERNSHCSVALQDNSIVLMGGVGYYYIGAKNDTWRSTDGGATWAQVNASSGWLPRFQHTCVAMPDGSIVLMGGRSGDGYLNDVWRSTDSGTTWTRVNASAGWPASMSPAGVVLPDSSIVLTLGDDYRAYTWRFIPAGSSAQNPSHTYTRAGTYQVALQAYNDDNFNSTQKAGYVTVSDPPGPYADFTGTPRTGTAPLAVTFTDRSTYDPTAWNWSFGDGTFSSEKNPHHVYTAGNTYTVTLNASNAKGYTIKTKADWIVVSPALLPPVADFYGLPTSGRAPLKVSFTNLSSDTPTSWAWFFGDETFAEPWIKVNASPGWTVRGQHTSVALPNGNIVLMGGWDENYRNDTWQSADNGKTWTLMNASSGWGARSGLSSVGMRDNSIVLTGGWDEENHVPRNDVWRSTDTGATWTLVNASPGWPKRYYHSTVALQDDLNSIVLMGGSLRNDTWRSTDIGATWTLLNASAGWAARSAQCSVALPDNSIVLMGGGEVDTILNDTWRSADGGGTWSLVNASSGWPPRYLHTCVAMPDGSIVLIGGRDYSDVMRDVWRSTDRGATWTSINASAGWGWREGHTSVVLPDSSIVLMGGTWYNDTWRFMPARSSAQNPSHTYARPGRYQVALQAYNDDNYNSTRKTGYIDVNSMAPATSGQWILDYGMDRTVDRRFQYGLSTDTPLVGDFNNDGVTDSGVFRSGQWILDYGMDRTVDRRFQYGLSTDTPLVGDFNNDGTTDTGVFRAGQWILDYGMDRTVDRRFQYGLGTDTPLVGDFNDDGVTDTGVFRAGQWILDYGMDRTVDRRFQYGLGTDTPLVGDFNDDGVTDTGVFRAGQWILDYGMDRTVDRRFQYGLATDTPLIGDFNNNDFRDTGVFRSG